MSSLEKVCCTVKKLMDEDRIKEGDTWYIVSISWWRALFNPIEAIQMGNDNILIRNENGHSEGDGNDLAQPSYQLKCVCNAPLIDEAFSRPHHVVLKPRLIEQYDYVVVSERVWHYLCHEFGFDWEIARPVITSGVTSNCVVETYPIVFQLWYWCDGMTQPETVKNEKRDDTNPLVVVVSETDRVDQVVERLHSELSTRLMEFFPNVTLDTISIALQVSYREMVNHSWRSLPTDQRMIRDLNLEDRRYKSGTDSFHDLLIEGRWYGSEDWRKGRFYSDIMLNQWRFELVCDQVIDGCDTAKKWYEARILEVSETKVKIHYRGWTSKWDVWLDRMSPQLAPLHTKVNNWRDLRPLDRVLVGCVQPDRAFPQWYQAEVRSVRTKSDEKEVLLSYNGKTEWRNVQDELLCEVGTHKTVDNIITTTPTRVTTPSTTYYKPTYEYGRGKPRSRGVVGLQNLGNTCFMNSMLQCLMNTKPLVDYFLETEDGKACFEKDVNENNPLGMKGRIAHEFANVVAKVWGNEYSIVAPVGLKSVIGQYAPQFAGYQQQDSQEVMNFILDGLHEDLNRVRNKPYTSPIEHNGRDDVIVAKEEWTQYLRRNDSIIVDHFMGQLRSHVTCSNVACGHESVTFDPFMSLSVPIPSEESIVIQVQLFWADGKIPTKYAIWIPKDTGASIKDVKKRLSELAHVPNCRLYFVQVQDHTIIQPYNDDTMLNAMKEKVIHVYELEFPLSQYSFCSHNLQPSKIIDNEEEKTVRLSMLIHHAPVASPVHTYYNGSMMSCEDEQGSKQRRVNAELFNTPLLVSIGTKTTHAELHHRVWKVIRRVITTDHDTDNIPVSLPYQLHLTQVNGNMEVQYDIPYNDEVANLPIQNTELSGSIAYGFTLVWSRHGYHQGYNQELATRVALHESMQKLNLDGNRSTSAVPLPQCITKFTEHEQLGESDTWYCPKCKEHVRAYKKFDLFKLPRVLIFHLKRFRYAQSAYFMQRDKISTLVTFPIEGLDLNEYVIGPKPASGLVYDLFAVSEHSGGLGGGHYTAVAKNPESSRWYNFNDSSTSDANPEDAVTSRAYVLFYLRRE